VLRGIAGHAPSDASWADSLVIRPRQRIGTKSKTVTCRPETSPQYPPGNAELDQGAEDVADGERMRGSRRSRTGRVMPSNER
jgi:hypothetical protein